MKSGEVSETTLSINHLNADIIILGSSKANHEYDPRIIEDKVKLSCYNTGKDGMGILYNYYILKSILNRIKPKIIVLDINPVDFFQSKESYDKLSTLLPYYYQNKELQPLLNLKSKYEKYKVLCKTYRFNSLIFQIIMNNIGSQKNISYKGYIPLFNVWSKPFKIYKQPTYDVIDTIKFNYLKCFINDANKKGCKVIVFVSPIYYFNSKENMIIQKVKSLCEGSNIFFKDFTKDAFFLNDRTLFDDEIHLNDRGAGIYTNFICKYLNE